MWSRTASRFEGARVGERELNDRQRQILGLIEKGHTNREIADVLGLSIDGAKWNVSEILTKLGLDSREEAADYWRWRKGTVERLRAARHALLAWPPIKWLAGAAGTGAVGLIAVMALLAMKSSSPAGGEGVTPFYLEARESVAVAVGPEEPREAVFRWTYLDADHYRQEYERILPWYESGTSVTVANGGETRSYSSEMNLFSVQPTEPLLAHQRLRATPIIMIGPAPASSMSGLMEILSHWGEGNQQSINGVVSTAPQPPPPVETGRDTLLGQDVVVIDYVQGTLWVEPDDMVILKHVSGHFSAEVTLYHKAPAFDSRGFILDRPAGADDITAPRFQVSGIPGTAGRPEDAPQWQVEAPDGSTRTLRLPGLRSGVFAPEFLPDGWSFRQGTGSGAQYVEWILRPPGWDEPCCNRPLGGDYIRIEQARGLVAVPLALTPGNPYEAIANPKGAGAVTWAVGDTVIRVSTLGSGAAFLKPVAESMVQAP